MTKEEIAKLKNELEDKIRQEREAKEAAAKAEAMARATLRVLLITESVTADQILNARKLAEEIAATGTNNPQP